MRGENDFAGKTFVVCVDFATVHDSSATLVDDICVLTERSVRPIVVAPDRTAARAIVRAMNRSTNIALSPCGSDAALGGVLYAA
ncbi:MAG: hypothetical protein M3R51_01730 [Candidatus Eremiobacteraeota bacterium]|nr:hypothetical protein [Candidatus Eremiobacteraeota bacterium]